MKALFTFDNRNLRELPVDPSDRIVSRQVPNAIFSKVNPEPVRNPKVISFSPAALSLLGLPTEREAYVVAREGEPPLLATIEKGLAGNELFEGSTPVAHCYCGHQFGSFSGQLGDGAAIQLGEIIANNQRWELQLKGAGPTPYSRGSDGRKVLRSSIREYLCSEAMFALGIATTRAGSVITSDSTVLRDPHYTGDQIHERCTVVSRIAPTFFRFGSFEIFKAGSDGYEGSTGRSGPSAGNTELKQQLLDYTVTSYFPDILPDSSSNNSNDRTAVYTAVFAEIVRRTALLVAQWQSVGFVHGVLNTDNMSIVGLTIDYGPFGFMEYFDFDFVPNSSDGSGRYRYSAQPKVCQWNLRKLAESWHALLPLSTSAPIVEQLFDEAYQKEYIRLFRSKLGLLTTEAEDETLVKDLLQVMNECRTDFTNTFLCLERGLNALCSSYSSEEQLEDAVNEVVDSLVNNSATVSELKEFYRKKSQLQKLEMDPNQTLQIYQILEQVRDEKQLSAMFRGADIGAVREQIMAELRKMETIRELSTEIKNLDNAGAAARKDLNDRRRWKAWVMAYKTRLDRETGAVSERLALMGSANPRFVLRNWIAQVAIAAAEKGDFSKVDTVLNMALDPFNSKYDPLIKRCGEVSSEPGAAVGEEASAKENEFLSSPPAWAASLVCSCSS